MGCCHLGLEFPIALTGQKLCTAKRRQTKLQNHLPTMTLFLTPPLPPPPHLHTHSRHTQSKRGCSQLVLLIVSDQLTVCKC